MSSSWDNWTATWSAPEPVAEQDSDAEIDCENVTSDVAAEELDGMLLELKLTNALSARQCCVLAFWAHRAGAKGLVEKLGMAPDKNTGAYSRHFDKVIGCTPSDSQFYDLPLGRRMRHSSFRTFEPIAVQPLHEALASEFALHSEELVGDLAAAREASRLPKIYLDHPWVKESGDAVIHPYVLHVDGVSFSRTDTVLCFFAYFSGRVESTC